jgi:pilus assembly protein FimV
MLRFLGLTLLTLCLAVPTASWALGLGDIHVDSALHQPLVAQIELVGALDDELGRLSATIASDETFQRYALERAPFIRGTTLVVGRDGQGRPVLNMRSTEKFTEPVVTLLVDLHAPTGELIREYTLFLDPAGLEAPANPPVQAMTATSAVPATPSESVLEKGMGTGATLAGSAQSSARADSTAHADTNGGANAELLSHTYTVARRDTLDHIVTAAGARSRTDRHRMMIAIYRANPAAFQNNFNRLHTGVMLHFPTAEQLAAISVADTNREYDAQMAAWRTPGHRIMPAVPQSLPGNANSAPAPLDAQTLAPDRQPGTESQQTDRAVLTQRVASLEQSLDRLRQELKQPLVVHNAVPVVAPPVAKPAPAPTEEVTSEDDEDEPAPVPRHGIQLVSMAGGVGLVLVAGAWLYLRRRNSPPRPATPHDQLDAKDEQPVEFSKPPAALPQSPARTSVAVDKPDSEPQQAVPKAAKNDSSWFEDSFSTPIADLLATDTTISLESEMTAELPADPTVKLMTTAPVTPATAAVAADTTVMLAPDFDVVGDTVEQKFSFFNPESTTNTEHVVMGSGLHEPKPFVERRKNPVDVLRQAIEREPDRSDLRLKLLELYYTAAEENRRAFLDATRQLAKNDKLASPEDWSRIADMGRTIAPGDEMFSDERDDKQVA